MRYRPFQSSLKYECSTLPVGLTLVTVENSLLTIQATFGGVVHSVVDPPGPEHETEERTLYRWGNYFIQHHAIGTPEQKSMDAMILYCALKVIPIEDDVADPHPSPYKAQLRSRWENILRRWNSYEKSNRNKKPVLRLLSEANRMGLAHTKEGRSCFFTSARLFGLGPSTIQIGDYVVNMPGCDSMMALRPLKIEQDIKQVEGNMGPPQHPAMTVVGDCWIPELVKSNRENTASNLRTFHIV